MYGASNLPLTCRATSLTNPSCLGRRLLAAFTTLTVIFSHVLIFLFKRSLRRLLPAFPSSFFRTSDQSRVHLIIAFFFPPIEIWAPMILAFLKHIGLYGSCQSPYTHRASWAVVILTPMGLHRHLYILKIASLFFLFFFGYFFDIKLSCPALKHLPVNDPGTGIFIRDISHPPRFRGLARMYSVLTSLRGWLRLTVEPARSVFRRLFSTCVVLPFVALYSTSAFWPLYTPVLSGSTC